MVRTLATITSSNARCFMNQSINSGSRFACLRASLMSGVTQNRPVKVEIKGFKTSHFLEQKTAPRNCPDAGPMGHVERPQSEPSGNDLHLRRPRLVPAAYSPRAGDRSRDSGPVFAVSKTSHFDPRL